MLKFLRGDKMEILDLITISASFIIIIYSIVKIIKSKNNKKALFFYVLQIVILSIFILMNFFDIFDFMDGFSNIIFLVLTISYLIMLFNKKDI